MVPPLQILHQDDALLVVHKPAGLVCHPSKSGPASSLIGRVRLHLGDGVSPQLVNRLDRETSGVVVLACAADAARTLRRLWETRQVTKEYRAIVHGSWARDRGEIDAPLGPDPASPVFIKDCVRPDGVPARTGFEVLRRFQRPEGPFTLLRVIPHTGRKHQIRIHLASLGHPVVGDKIYGGDEQLYLDFVFGRLTEAQRRRLVLPHQALHAQSLRFPWRGGEAVFATDPEPWFTAFAAAADAPA